MCSEANGNSGVSRAGTAAAQEPTVGSQRRLGAGAPHVYAASVASFFEKTSNNGKEPLPGDRGTGDSHTHPPCSFCIWKRNEAATNSLPARSVPSLKRGLPGQGGVSSCSPPHRGCCCCSSRSMTRARACQQHARRIIFMCYHPAWYFPLAF